MKRSSIILVFFVALAVVQLACSLPSATSPSGGTLSTVTPMIASTATVTPSPSPTNTQSVHTATPTATAEAPSTGNIDHGSAACTYRATFVSDATIPDDSLVAAGSMFIKAWLVRNDGTCTWGPNNYALRALAFTGGSQMGAPPVIPLHDTVRPGQTADISVTLTAPTTPGTYTSSWMFRVSNDPNLIGPNVGVGPHGDQPLYARIRVGAGLTRLQFRPGTTTVILTGDLGANETRGYLVAAQQGQVIVASTCLDAWNLGVRTGITTRDELPLPDVLPNLDVAAELPETGDYIVWLTGGNYATEYHLAVTIPVRVAFAPGTTSATFNGSISNGSEVWYVVHASAGRTLTASLDRSNVGLSIMGLQDPTVPGPLHSDDITTSWTGTMPITQDYIIRVTPTLVDSTPYTLDVMVE